MGGVNSKVEHPSAILPVLSASRMAPYLSEAERDEATALQLYEWAAHMPSAAFEIIAHLEVALRNVIDEQLRKYVKEDQGGIPWLFCTPPLTAESSQAIVSTRERLISHQRNSRDQITANLSFGFWSGMLGKNTKNCGGIRFVLHFRLEALGMHREPT